MHIIIDGYNILKQILPQQEIGLQQRRAFTNMLGKYAAKKNHTITLVFDGGPTTWSSQEKDHGITVIYSGAKQSADDVIKKLLPVKKYGVLLVSSDNELKGAAARSEIVSIDALEFYTRVKEELACEVHDAVPHIFTKTSATAEAWLDELMTADRRHISKDEDDEKEKRVSPGQKLAKKERAYLQKIKKL